MRRISKRTAVVLGAAGTVLVAGVAYAAWTSTGSGTGSVASTTSVNSTIDPASGGSLLYPGGGTDFTVTVNNPNSYPVKVDSISTGSSVLINTSCAAGSVYSDALSPVPNAAIPAGGSASYTLHAHMIANPDNACKEQPFSLTLTAALSSAAS